MTEQRTPQQMTDLRITETSGVDHPAHQVSGWMVLKNREPLSDDEIVKLLSAASSGQVAKHDQGTGATPPPTGAPGNPSSNADPRAARTGSYQGSDYAECVKVSVEQDGLTPEEAAAYCRVATAGAGGEAVPENTQVTKAEGDEKDRRIAELESELAKARATSTGGDDDPVLKALREHEVPEVIAKAILDSRKEAEEAKAAATVEKAARVGAEWTEFAKSYRSLSATPTSLGPALMRLYERSPEDFNVVKGVLDMAEGALRQSSLFSEIGKSSGVSIASGDSYGQIEQMAKSLATEKNVPYEKALTDVLNTPEGRDAYARYVSEREAR